MADKIYAVRKGRKTGIFHDWGTCKEQVNGFPGAEYKSFKTMNDACDYLGFKKIPETKMMGVMDEIKTVAKKLTVPEKGCAVAYVDGSWHPNRPDEFCSGVLFLYDVKQIEMKVHFEDADVAKMHNVAGEIQAALLAVTKAITEQVESLTIYHDYEGIAKWVNGEWEAKKKYTKMYKTLMKNAMEHLDITFVWTKGHDGTYGNETADRLANEAFDEPVCKNEWL